MKRHNRGVGDSESRGPWRAPRRSLAGPRASEREALNPAAAAAVAAQAGTVRRWPRPAGVAAGYAETERRRDGAWPGNLVARFPFFLCRQTHNMAD